MKRALILVLGASCALELLAQPAVDRNPHTAADDVAAGGRIYRSHCAECHGLDGAGGRGPDLTSGRFRHGDSDADLYDTIDSGIPGSEMPGVYFEGRQIWQLVAFVRSLSQGAASPEISGDPGRGQRLFRGKGGCSQCHRVNGEGGRTGPDLSNIGDRRILSNLKASLLEPNQVVSSSFWRVQAVSKDGRFSGTRLNEDTYTLQILDSEERLVSLRKVDLASYEIDKTSSMPSYKEGLTSQELDDVVAYLSTLRGGARP